MSETRIMPKAKPRSTGIERTNTQVARPKASGGGASHVSASAGSGSDGQERVNAVRHPNGAPAARRQTDAKVQLISKADSAGGPGRPNVQLVQRGTATDAPLLFDLDETMMLGHLTDKYVEACGALDDKVNLAIATRVLAKLGELAKANAAAAAAAAARAAAVAVAPQAPQTPSAEPSTGMIVEVIASSEIPDGLASATPKGA